MRAESTFGLIAAFFLALAANVVAHPLGNFSINQYSALQVGEQDVEVRYIVDMAEIPTFQEIQARGLVAKADDPSANQYIALMAEKLRAGLSLEVNGQPIALHIESREIIFSEGAGGLPTLKISVNYKVRLPGGVGAAYTLGYRDNNFPGRAGWKEIIAVAGHGVKLLNSSVPETDRSARLSDYPMDLLNSPPQQVEARVEFFVNGAGDRRRQRQQSIIAGNSKSRRCRPSGKKTSSGAIGARSFSRGVDPARFPG